MLTIKALVDHAYNTRWRFQKDGERSRERARVFLLSMELGFGDGVRVSVITDRDVREAVSEMTRAGKSNATINRHLAAASCAFKIAYDDGLLESAGPRFKFLPESGARERVPTRDEVARMLRALRPGCASRVVRLMYRTGMRRGEVLNLMFSDILWDDGPGVGHGLMVRLRDTKNGETRAVPVPAAVTSLFWWCERRTPSPRWVVFPISTTAFSDEWVAARKKAGIGPWFVPHCLRHARATELVRCGTPIPVVAKILGHRDWRTTQRYTHPNEADMREAMETRRAR